MKKWYKDNTALCSCSVFLGCFKMLVRAAQYGQNTAKYWDCDALQYLKDIGLVSVSADTQGISVMMYRT